MSTKLGARKKRINSYNDLIKLELLGLYLIVGERGFDLYAEEIKPIAIPLWNKGYLISQEQYQYHNLYTLTPEALRLIRS